MRLVFIPIVSEKNEWIGWFGENVIKVRLKTDNSLDNKVKALLNFLKDDLGIRSSSINVISAEKRKVTLEFPNICWELFLTVIR
jgi:hypothetical protein